MICPAPAQSLSGNRATANRWARILRGLKHRVTIAQTYAGEPCDVLIALHARKSAGAVLRFRRDHPGKPIIVALTGTDLYRDIYRSAKAQRTLELATRLVGLQPLAAEELNPHLRRKLRIIYQSASTIDNSSRDKAARLARGQTFDVCVAGHLRNVKDPLRAAYAARRLPGTSRIRILHAGAALDPGFASKARAEQGRNPRYRWLGEISRGAARRLIARSRLMVLSSRMEGGANVISEALVAGVPVIASRIPGSVGLLGARYAGYFPAGDTRALAELLRRAESDPKFYGNLRAWCTKRARLFEPHREVIAWKALLAELCEN